MSRAACRSCGRPILWVVTATGNRMPVDWPADPSGNVEVDLVAETAIVHGRPPISIAAGAALFNPHFQSCPDAGKWRRGRAKTPPSVRGRQTGAALRPGRPARGDTGRHPRRSAPDR